MMHFRTRHTLIILADRVLHAIRPGWRRQLSIRELVLPGFGSEHHETPSGLLNEALPKVQLPGIVDVVLGTTWTQLELIALPGKTISSEEANSVAETVARRLQAQGTHRDALIPRVARLPEHLLVAAIPDAVREKISAALADQKIAIASLQPLFTWLSQDPQARFRQKNGWVVLTEPGAVSIAHLTNGDLDSLRAYRMNDEGVELGNLLRRQEAATGHLLAATEIISVAGIKPTLPVDWPSSSLLRDFPN
jgi:hypothetical protein